ncbi:CHAT domain-containing protein [bacterium]|nr:CHAT domain-containing protein [bacterium]
MIYKVITKSIIVILSLVIWIHADLAIAESNAIEEHNRILSGIDSLIESENWQEAESLSQKLADYTINNFGEFDSLTQKALHKQGLIMWNQERYSDALPYFQKALEVVEEVYGDTSFIYSRRLEDIGYCYYYLGKYQQAGIYMEQSLELDGASLGGEHPDVASNMDLLAYIYYMQGRFFEAESLYQQALRIMKKNYGSDHINVAEIMHNLSLLYVDLARYAEAESLSAKVMKIATANLGNDDPLIAVILNNLGRIQKNLGNYSKAESLYKRGIGIREKALGSDHPAITPSLNNLAAVYRVQGKSAEAKELLERALEIDKKNYGPGHPNVAVDLNNLGFLYNNMGNLVKAESLYLAALEITEKVHGTEHKSVATDLNNLAVLYERLGKYSVAESLYLRSLQIREKVFGSKHLLVAQSLNNLAEYYFSLGKYDRAESLLKSALEIRENLLNPDHPDVAKTLYNSAILYHYQDRFCESEPIYLRTNDILNKRLRYSAGYMPERDLIRYVDIDYHRRKSFEAFALEYYSQKREIAGDWYNYLLVFKGAIGRSATALRAIVESSGDSALTGIADDMVELRWRAANLSLREDSLIAEYVQNLVHKADSLEGILTRKSSEYRDFEGEFSVAWKDILGALKPDEAAVEFTTAYSRQDSQRYYVALVLKKDAKHPEVISIASENDVDSVMVWYNYLASTVFFSSDSRGISQRVYDRMWQPLESYLEGVHRIYISPEKELYKLNFGILLDESGKTLMEKYDIRILNSTGDLVKTGHEFSQSPCVVFGAPDYDWQDEAKDSINIRAFKTHYRQNILDEEFEYLESSELEAQSITQILKDHGFDVVLKTGKEATEEEFKKLESPRILHLATHGFVLQDQDRTALQEGEIESPMMRSGIALAGANRLIKELNIPDGEEDGILTASELMEMPFRGTEIVVLSACETGLGMIRTGEGVYGLRRALQLAGARFVMLSLWKVPDKETGELMELFYHNWLNGKEIHEALKQAQIEVRKKAIERYGYDSPLFWGAFVIVGN